MTELKTDYKYIRMVLAKRQADRKTDTWIIKGSNVLVLGIIRWYGPWRQYCFYPAHDTVFNKECLNDIYDFITQIMNARKKVIHDTKIN